MLKALKISAVAVLALVAFSQPAMARDFGTIYTECGLGAMVAPTAPGAAAVTNVIWDYGTSAISSNVSSPDTCRGGKEKTASFIHESYESLENDLASGSGTYLDTLAVLAGYDSLTKQKFIETLRDDFAGIVSKPGYSDQSRFDQAKTLFDLVYKQADIIS